MVWCSWPRQSSQSCSNCGHIFVQFLALLSQPAEDGPCRLCWWAWRSQAELLSQGITPGVQSAGVPPPETPAQAAAEIIQAAKTILLLPQCFNCVWELVNRAQAVCDRGSLSQPRGAFPWELGLHLGTGSCPGCLSAFLLQFCCGRSCPAPRGSGREQLPALEVIPAQQQGKAASGVGRALSSGPNHQLHAN